MANKFSSWLLPSKEERIYDSNTKRYITKPKNTTVASNHQQTKVSTPQPAVETTQLKVPESLAFNGYPKYTYGKMLLDYNLRLRTSIPAGAVLGSMAKTGVELPTEAPLPGLVPFVGDYYMKGEPAPKPLATQTTQASATKPTQTVAQTTQAAAPAGGYFIDWLKQYAPEYTSYASRKDLAARYGIQNYVGSPEQNRNLWALMRNDRALKLYQDMVNERKASKQQALEMMLYIKPTPITVKSPIPETLSTTIRKQGGKINYINLFS